MKLEQNHSCTPGITTYYNMEPEDIYSLEKRFPFTTALKIALFYVLIGFLWILFSDKILLASRLDPALISAISIVKGWVYVLLTGVLLFYILLRSLKKIRSINQALIEKYAQLAAADIELQSKVDSLMESEEKYRLISEATNDGIWDEKHGVRHFSERWLEMTGYTKEDMNNIGDWMSLIHPEDIDKVQQKLSMHRKSRDPKYKCEYRLKFKNGEYRWILSMSTLVFDEHGNIIRSAGSHTDITDLKESQEKLRKLAYKDFLTGLSNRTLLFYTVSDHIIAKPEKKKAIIFFDIDNFKHINDTAGHATGDKIIKIIGQRLDGLADSNKSVYRNSGDEFVIFIHEYEAVEEIEAYAGELIKTINAPISIQNQIYNISISVGIALYPTHAKEQDKLFKCADIAMYKSKKTNRGRFTFYHKSMEHELRERMLIGNELKGAVERGEFMLHYQPLLDISINKVCKLEALLRWNNRSLGNVPPSEFIGVAEETLLIGHIGDWVMTQACRFLKELHDKGQSNIVMSINVSIKQLAQQGFVDRLFGLLNEYEISPDDIELEITESVMIESYDNIKEKLLHLKSRGIRIALDDFGTGYSSLNYLANMPINTIKIDKSFIDLIDKEASGKTLTNMMIMLGRELGLSVVAEGVETKEQLTYLKEHGCNIIQGYYFSRPLPSEMIISLLNDQTIKVHA